LVKGDKVMKLIIRESEVKTLPTQTFYIDEYVEKMLDYVEWKYREYVDWMRDIEEATVFEGNGLEFSAFIGEVLNMALTTQFMYEDNDDSVPWFVIPRSFTRGGLEQKIYQKIISYTEKNEEELKKFVAKWRLAAFREQTMELRRLSAEAVQSFFQLSSTLPKQAKNGEMVFSTNDVSIRNHFFLSEVEDELNYSGGWGLFVFLMFIKSVLKVFSSVPNFKFGAIYETPDGEKSLGVAELIQTSEKLSSEQKETVKKVLEGIKAEKIEIEKYAKNFFPLVLEEFITQQIYTAYQASDAYGNSGEEKTKIKASLQAFITILANKKVLEDTPWDNFSYLNKTYKRDYVRDINVPEKQQRFEIGDNFSDIVKAINDKKRKKEYSFFRDENFMKLLKNSNGSHLDEWRRRQRYGSVDTQALSLSLHLENNIRKHLEEVFYKTYDMIRFTPFTTRDVFRQVRFDFDIPYYAGVKTHVILDGLDEEQGRRALSILKERNVHKNWIKQLIYIVFREDSFVEHAGFYYDSQFYSERGIEINLRTDANYAIKIFIHELGHLIHFNSPRALQIYWANVTHRTEEMSPSEIELLQRHPSELGVEDRFVLDAKTKTHLRQYPDKNKQMWPSAYSQTNNRETFSEVFDHYILNPEKLSPELYGAMQYYLSEAGVKPITEKRNKKHNVNQTILRISRQHNHKRI